MKVTGSDLEIDLGLVETVCLCVFVIIYIPEQLSDQRPVNRGQLYQTGTTAESPIGKKLIWVSG